MVYSHNNRRSTSNRGGRDTTAKARRGRGGQGGVEKAGALADSVQKVHFLVRGYRFVFPAGRKSSQPPLGKNMPAAGDSQVVCAITQYGQRRVRVFVAGEQWIGGIAMTKENNTHAKHIHKPVHQW